MLLRTKVIFITLFVIIMFGALNYGIQQYIILPSFTSLEREEAIKDIERVTEALWREIHHLDLLVHDWGAWDNTYDFIEDKNSDYINSNLLLETFLDSNLDLIYYIDRTGKVIWGDIYDLKTEEHIEMDEFPKEIWPETHPLLQHNTIDHTISGVILTTRGPMLIASRPIIKSDDTGPIRGTIMMGRMFNDELITNLNEQTRASLHVWPIAGGSLHAEEQDALEQISKEDPYLLRYQSSDSLLIYTAFPDFQDEPALLIRVDIPREISKKGTIVIHFALISILIAGLVFLVVMLVLLQYTIVGPLSKLTHHATTIGKTGDMSNILVMQRKDEIGILSKEFNCMIQQLDEIRKKLIKQSYYSGMAEMAANVLHNIRNSLGPMIGTIDRVHQNLRGISIEQIQTAQRELDANHCPAERKRNLKDFISLANENISARLHDSDDQLNSLVQIISQLEKMLADQDQYSHAERILESISLHDAVREAANQVPYGPDDGISIIFDPRLEEIGPLSTHKPSFLKVLENLIKNAAESIKRAKQSKGVINIQANQEQVSGVNGIHIRIQDNGEGIATDIFTHIFERGFSTKSDISSGYGLHWCANTISAMHGSIYAESEGHGQGACLHLIVPENPTILTTGGDDE